MSPDQEQRRLGPRLPQRPGGLGLTELGTRYPWGRWNPVLMSPFALGALGTKFTFLCGVKFSLELPEIQGSVLTTLNLTHCKSMFDTMM